MVVFNALEREDIDQIIQIELKKVVGRIEALGYHITLSDAAKTFLAEKGFDKQYGARPLKRAIQKYIEDTLAEEIVNSRLSEGDTIELDLSEDKEQLVAKTHKTEDANEKKS